MRSRISERLKSPSRLRPSALHGLWSGSHGRRLMKSFKVSEFAAPLVEVDAPTPEPKGSEVLLKVRAAGVCHSDLHIWEGGYQLGHGRKPLSLKDRGVSLPRTMGHETAGEIVAFGPDVKER